jgi:hypothetical protein
LYIEYVKESVQTNNSNEMYPYSHHLPLRSHFLRILKSRVWGCELDSTG